MRGRDNIRTLGNAINGYNDNNENKRDTRDMRELKAKIEKIYQIEFEEGIGTMLNESESIFINKIFSKIRLILTETIQMSLIEDKSIKEFLKYQDEIIMDKYFNTKKYFLKIHNEFKKNPKFVDILSKFRKHCNNCPDVPIHNCQNKLILVRENNEVKYVLCSGCKDVFLSNSLILFCASCNIDYYSSLVSSNEEMEYQPATWENYHCGHSMNEQMLCLKCKDKLYIRLNDNNLFCIKCKFISNPLKIIWICVYCKKDFQSQAKIYNPIEFKIIKNTVKEALLNRINGAPKYFNCCVDDKKTCFYHKNSCKGDLYLSEMNRKSVLVCSKCKSIISLEGFWWTCPKCFNIFLDIDKKNLKTESSSSENIVCNDNTNEEIENKQLYVRKNIASQMAPKRESNFSRIDSEKGKRNHSVYRFTNGNKNFKDDKKKETVLVEINEEEQENFETSKIKKNTTINLANKEVDQEKISGGVISNFVKESINNININKLMRNNSPPINALKNNQDLFIKKILLGNVNNEINKSRGEAEIVEEHKGQKNRILYDDNKNLNNSSPKFQLSEMISPKKKGDFQDYNSNYGSGYEKRISKSNQYNNDNYSSGGCDRDYSKTVSNFEVERKNDDLSNFNVDEFKIFQSIGEGSFGIIYSCENIYSKEKYALKKIIVNSEEEMNLFISEYELVRKLNHKNVLSIYGMTKKVLDFSTRVLYILMELSLSDWDKEIRSRYKSNNFYKESEIIHGLKQITDALAFLQSKGISHRDIKPQNILVFPNQVFKIADFGEAKEVDYAKKQMETLRGTELYMSPILFNTLRSTDKKNVKHNAYKSDVFSLGYCLLYAATLSFRILYDLRNVNNQKNLICIVKNYLMKKYSTKFIELIVRMIDVNEETRYDFVDLNNHLNVNF